jgi:hypothetical protein
MKTGSWSTISRLVMLLVTLSASYSMTGISITDSTCPAITPVTPCEGYSSHGCTSANFFVEHSQPYWLTASIDNCGGGNCTGCVSEAYFYEGTTFWTCIHSGCCVAESTSVNLVTGHTYTVYCCLLPCGNANCTTSCGNCPARATVHA